MDRGRLPDRRSEASIEPSRPRREVKNAGSRFWPAAARAVICLYTASRRSSYMTRAGSGPIYRPARSFCTPSQCARARQSPANGPCIAAPRQLRGPDQTRILAHAQRLGAAAAVSAVSEAPAAAVVAAAAAAATLPRRARARSSTRLRSARRWRGGRGHTPARPAWPARAAAAASCAQPRRTRRTCANPPSSSARAIEALAEAEAGGGWRRQLSPPPLVLSCGQAQKASSPPASASSHPLAVAWPPRLGGSDRAWRARQPCTRRGRRLRTARVALAWSCRCTLWRRWCNAAGQWARRAAGAPLATRCASCSGAVDAAGGGEATAGGLAWPPFASGPGTSADLAGCSLDQQRVGSARERTVAWCACGRAGGAFGPRRRAHGSEATARSGHRMRSGRPAAPGAARCSEKAPAARPRPRALQKCPCPPRAFLFFGALVPQHRTRASRPALRVLCPCPRPHPFPNLVNPPGHGPGRRPN